MSKFQTNPDKKVQRIKIQTFPDFSGKIEFFQTVPDAWEPCVWHLINCTQVTLLEAGILTWATLPVTKPSPAGGGLFVSTYHRDHSRVIFIPKTKYSTD